MWALSAATLLLAVPATPSAATQQAPDTIEVVIAVAITGGPGEVVLARAVDDRLFLPVTGVLDLARIRVDSVRVGRGVYATLEPAGTPMHFETRGGAMAADALWSAGILYVAVPVLERTLGVRASVDWSELLVRFDGGDHLPAVRMAERTRRRARPTRPPPAPPPFTLESVPPVDGGALDWSYTTPTADLGRTSTFTAGLGLAALGGSLVVDQLVGVSGGATAARTQAVWRRAWVRGPVRQVELGDAAVGGLRPRLARGVVVSNIPFVRPAAFDPVRLGEPLPPGWTIEIYAGGALVDVVESPPAGVTTPLELPLRFGSNPIEIVRLGPFGERLVQHREVFVPRTRLPRGSFEYLAGAGQCRFGECDATGNADARWAPRSWVTLQAGVEGWTRDTVPDLWHPYARASVAPHQSVNLTATAALGALVTLDLLVAPTTDFQLSTAGSLFDQGTVLPLLQPAGIARQLEGSMLWRPPLRRRPIYLRLAGALGTGSIGKRGSLSGAVGVRLAGAQLSADLLHSQVTLTTGTTVTTRFARFGVTRNLPGPGWLRGVFVQGVLQIQPDGLDQLRIAMARQIGASVRVELAGGWSAQRGAVAGLTLSTTLPVLRATNAVEVAGDGTLGGIQSFEGSLLWNTRSGSVRAGSGRALGLSGVTGHVFVDANGNQRWDTGEEGLPGAIVAVGGRAVRTDDRGRFQTWDLTPFEPAVLALDTLSIVNPFLVPTRAAGTFVPAPNSYRRVDLPLTPGAELSGVARWADGRPAGGYTLELVARDGSRTYRTITFADGTFYILGVAPGSWDLRVAPDLAARLNVAAASVTVEVPASATGTAVVDVVLTVRRP